jgi:hypothetical protein
MIGAGVAAALLASPASAQVANLTGATCGQMLDLSLNERQQLMVWLHGYYAGAAQRAVIDRAKLEEVFKTLQATCEQNRATPLIGANVRAILLGEAAPTPPLASQPPSPRRSQASSSAPAPSGNSRPTPLR